ncbi:MAG: hypothetical protein K2M65_07490, partial [Muribaculaceae bacterium]|nr:hypothetical protein [Muribaculaceae bacterium]
LEGIARELVNRIQNIRKGRDYSITDRIDVVVAPNTETDDAVALYRDYIADQVLASSLTVGEVSAESETLDLDGVEVVISITRNSAKS